MKQAGRFAGFLIPALLVAGEAVPSNTSQIPLDTCPYSEEWLAANHMTYDNKWTALYETELQRRAGLLSDEQAGALEDTLGRVRGTRGIDIRMSNASFPAGQNEYQIVISPVNALFAVGSSNDNQTAGVGLYRTSDGGQTWAPFDAPIGTAACCDPGVAYDATGAVYAAILDTSPAQTYVIRSTDNGVTWSAPTTIATPDRENITVDNGATSPRQGTVYVTYSFGVGNRISGVKSTDNGQTWGAPFQVGVTPAPGNQQSSDPYVASDGTLYVGFQCYQGSGCPLTVSNWLAKSTDGGGTFTTTEITGAPIRQGGVCKSGDPRGYFCRNAAGGDFRSRSHPIISGSPTDPSKVYAVWSGGDLEIAYTCGVNTGFHSDTLFSKSTDGGATWSVKMKLNTDPPGHDQYFPWIDTAPNGTVWVGWHDRRADPLNFEHIYYQAYSTDEGTTWTESAVADQASLPRDFIGDYAGIATSNSVTLGMWWDSRIRVGGDPYTDPTPPPTTSTSNVDVITGPGPGQPNPANVKGFNSNGTANGLTDFTSYSANQYGSNVALGNYRNTLAPMSDILTGPGPGAVYGPQVRGFARNGTTIGKVSFYAYGTLKYGVNVNSGDVDGDGFEEILTAPGPGSVFGPHIRGWNFDNSTLTAMAKISFFAYGTLKYGAEVAGGEIDNDAFSEILASPGPSPAFGAQVRGYNFDNSAITSMAKVNFVPFATFVDGAHPSAGDLDNDAIEEIVVAPGPDPAANAQIRGYNFDGTSLTLIAAVDFDGMPGANRYGATVDAMDLDDDGFAEMAVGTGFDPTNGGPHVKGWNYDGGTVTAIATLDFDAYATTLRYGVNVTMDEVGP